MPFMTQVGHLIHGVRTDAEETCLCQCGRRRRPPKPRQGPESPRLPDRALGEGHLASRASARADTARGAGSRSIGTNETTYVVRM